MSSQFNLLSINDKAECAGKCHHCGEGVVGRNRKYCANACARKAENAARKKPANCKHCGKSFMMGHGCKGFCSLSCGSAALQGSVLTAKAIPPCTCCHAKIGFGLQKSAEFLGTTKSTIAAARSIFGIKTTIPASGSWAHQPKEKTPEQQWEAIYHAEWMKEIRERFFNKVFPDWGYLWELEAMRRRYHSLSIEEKRAKEKGRDKEKKRLSRRKWGKANKSRRRIKDSEYSRNRRATDPAFKIAMSCRGRIREALKNNYTKKTIRSEELTGCGWGELRQWLERQFIGCMTWDNYGKAWHVDHIVPCSYFDLSKEEEQRRCFHYTNLRPLWAKTNIRRQDYVGHITPTLCLSFH